MCSMTQQDNNMQKKESVSPDLLQHLQQVRAVHLQGPRLGNIFLEDLALQRYLQQTPLATNHGFRNQLVRLGDSLNSVYLNAARNAQENPPRLQQFDSYGRRIDNLHLSEGWRELGRLSAKDGIVAMAYEEDKFQLKQYQRFGQLVVLYMYHASSGLYGCPLAMTDGAAYTLRPLQKNALFKEAYTHLTSRADAWTSGQWMTEKKGGSNISNTETVAVFHPATSSYRLYGYKWFTSATDSQVALALAKVVPSGPIDKANLLLIKPSLFYVKTRKQHGELNQIEIVRLKDKLGTEQLPTAQLVLKGSEGYLVGTEGSGVKMVSKMLTVTRIYNAATAVGIMQRVLALCRDYASRRRIGAVLLADMGLQQRVLAEMSLTHRGSLAFYLAIAELFSKEHAHCIEPHEANLLRVLTPVLKLFTAKQVLRVTSEGLESFGGLGYIQGTMLPTLFRDAQVLSIWQGTTNVLCMDFVRAVSKQQNHIPPILSIIRYFTICFQFIGTVGMRENKMVEASRILTNDYLAIIRKIESGLKCEFVGMEQELRTICLGLARLFIACILQRNALKSMRNIDIELSWRWAKKGLFTVQDFNLEMDKEIGLGLNEIGDPSSTGDVDKRGKIRPKF